MKTILSWDEANRHINFKKHGFDFADAGEVLESRYRLDSLVMRNGELRRQSISYALDFLAVLTLVRVERDCTTRIISFRRASGEERELYYAWLKNECHEP
jgi:uncharacterized protein